jgi:NADPH:quinone reductase
MRAIFVDEPGGPEVLRLEDVEIPQPGPEEVLIEVAVAGVNFADVGMRAGMMGGPHAFEPPYTPGFEAAGVVAALGEGTEGVAEGDRVAAVLPAGGYAEYAVAPAGSVVRIPDGAGFADASALLVQGLTAYGVLHDAARVGDGDAVLVMAAGGGVGTLAVQLAKLAGAGTVIGAAGRRGKLDLALSLGADDAVDYTGGGWVDEVLEATGGRGVDVALECVGGELGARAYECLAPLGRLVTYGAAGGEGLRPPDMWQLNLKGQTVGGYGGPWLRPGAAGRAREEISGHLRSGSLKVVVGGSFRLEDAPEAHKAIEERRTSGKVLLTVR